MENANAWDAGKAEVVPGLDESWDESPVTLEKDLEHFGNPDRQTSNIHYFLVGLRRYSPELCEEQREQLERSVRIVQQSEREALRVRGIVDTEMR